MNTFTVETDCGTSRDFESRSEAEQGKETHVDLCEECGEADVRVEADPEPGDGDRPAADGADATDAMDAIDATDATDVTDATGPADVRPAGSADDPGNDAGFDGVPDSMLTDPLDVVPDYMVDVVEGQPTINKRGYAVIANHFDIVVQAEALATAGETDHEYAEYVARAWRKEDGPENAYTGHATARASEDRRGIADNLNEMAETRAMKRAVAWASGVGILAWEELAGDVEADEESARAT